MPASAAALLNRFRSPLLPGSDRRLDEADPDAAFEQGLAVIKSMIGEKEARCQER